MKKELEIPYFKGKPQYWQGDRNDEMRPNTPFTETLKFLTYSRGNSSAKLIFVKLKDYPKFEKDHFYDGIQYEVFMTDIKDIINKMVNGIIEAEFMFVKRGQNFGIQIF